MAASDRALAEELQEVPGSPRLVVGAAGAVPAERLLVDYRSGRLAIDVEVPRVFAQDGNPLPEEVLVGRPDGAGQPIGVTSDDAEGVVRILDHANSDDRAEDLDHGGSWGGWWSGCVGTWSQIVVPIFAGSNG